MNLLENRCSWRPSEISQPEKRDVALFFSFVETGFHGNI